jgi:UDP-N-acetylmuramoylalanine--D-glutamate ligase
VAATEDVRDAASERERAAEALLDAEPEAVDEEQLDGEPDAVADALLDAEPEVVAEVMLEVEILEISRDRLTELGISWPGSLTLSPLISPDSPFDVLTLRDLQNLRSQNLAARIDAHDLPQVWVLELSSFQLEGLAGFEPTAATVLNLTQDHLDWHGSMDAYAAAKARIFGANGLMVINREDARVMAMLPEPVRLKGGKIEQRAHITFGADMPQRPGDFGIEVLNGMTWLVRALEADETIKRRRDEVLELHFQRLMPVEALRIRGRHNAVNALSALALAVSAGCPLGPMLYGLREYRGEPHRVEPVGIVGEIEYFDDSKGTNVGATVAALQGLGAERQLVVILGGDGKGQDFSPLADPVARHARAAVLIGRDAPQIRAVLAPQGVTILEAESMEQAVRLAAGRAHAGDAVLMSPACAS